MAKYQTYAEYKDSGVEWLGEIPSHWDLRKFKHHFRSAMGETILGADLIEDGKLPVYSATEGDHFFGYVNSSSVVLEKGDFVIPARGNSIGFPKLVVTTSTCSQTTIYAKMHKKIHSKFTFYYLLGCKPYLFQFVQTAIPQITVEEVKNNHLVHPSLEEQTQIAKFLDHETAKIDHLIEKQQQLIELLKEKRQAVISHAVTKGLDPNVPMKDSGVEWLGEVPEHWIVKSYRLASRIYRGKFGHRPRNDPAFYDGDYPFIQTGDVARAGKYITSYSQTLNEKGKEVSQLFPKGTLMMAIAANIGDIAILGFEAYAPDSVVGFKPNNDIDLEFLRYSFIAALPALEQTSTQSTQANLNVERIGAVKGTFPSLQEQREIVGYLDNLLEQYRNLVKIAENAISLMQERRTALISAAVTGKIDVRHWQAPTVAEADTELSA
ncbi:MULTISPECIES: restriction endonuclease subunit S [unclassified Acinetobacter]|uniref:restriction endonuclease subunit S n=1 Tax=unclassified Acinetobacter TaxID=196816 RepID=UPI0015D30FEB|nr:MULTISPECIES: restriction endonuclease subunit S [unclassified Acinetobacter]